MNETTQTDFEYGYKLHPPESKRYGDKHVWWLKGPKGAIHIWIQMLNEDLSGTFPDRCYGGVEKHSPVKPYSFSPDEAPCKDCWLLGGDCWPDGTTLQWEANVKPVILPYILEGNLEALSRWMPGELMSWYVSQFGPVEEEDLEFLK